jgi:Bacterial PH domain
VNVAVGHETAIEQLGGWRFGARGELRAVARLLGPGEQVLGMALGSIGNWRGRLFVATDSRVLLVHKPVFRPARFTDVPYGLIRDLQAAPQAGGWRIDLDASGQRQSWNLHPADCAERLVRLVADRSAAEQPAAQPAVGGTCASTRFTPVSLPVNLGALAVVVLFFTGVLPRDPALLAFLALAVVLAVVEWRAGVPTLQIALGVVTAVAVALFVFELLPFGAGALLAGTAVAAEIGVRRRVDRTTAPR